MRAGQAARLTPQLDRLALCVHRPSGRHPEFRATVERLQLPANSPVVVAARFIVRGHLRLEDLQLLNRFESRTAVAMGVQYQIEAGFLRSEGEDLVPSPGLQEASRLVLRLQAEAATELWSDHAASLPDLVTLGASLVEMALADPPVEVPTFVGQVQTHDAVPDTPAGQLLGRITELRYLRSDLHAAVLAEHGLAGPRARAVNRLWKGHSVEDEDAKALAERGLAETTPKGWDLTGPARSMRDEVERTTNDLTASVLGGFGESKSKVLIATLSELAGEDPRPEADR